MKWLWFSLLIPIGLIVIVAFEKPKIGSYQAVELEYDKALNSYFATINGQEIDVVSFDRADTTEMCAGMPIYCLQVSQSRWVRIWEYHFSPIDVNPNENGDTLVEVTLTYAAVT